jgi:hypothetical protein
MLPFITTLIYPKKIALGSFLPLPLKMTAGSFSPNPEKPSTTIIAGS